MTLSLLCRHLKFEEDEDEDSSENDHILYFNLLEPFIQQYNIVGNKISSANQSLNKISSPVNVSNDNAQAILLMDNIKLI